MDLGGTESVGFGGSDTACRQFSHLLACCWGLHQRNGIPPELGAGPSCLISVEMGGQGSTGYTLGA